MIDTKDLAKAYHKMPIEKLVALTAEMDKLQPEALPILYAILNERGKAKEALLVQEYLSKEPATKAVLEMSTEELQEIVTERLEQGEPMESIILHLKDQGIQVFDIFNEEQKSEDGVLEYITSLKDQGLNKDQINNDLQEKLGIEKENSEVWESKLKSRGKMNRLIGILCLILAVILLIIRLATTGGMGFGWMIFLFTGIMKIGQAHRQLKKIKS